MRFCYGCRKIMRWPVVKLVSNSIRQRNRAASIAGLSSGSVKQEALSAGKPSVRRYCR